MTAIFDTHAHYDDDAFNDDREQLLAALPGQGIARVVDVGASLASCRKVLELMEQYDYIYGAIGVHPSETAELTEESYSWLKEQCQKEKCLAVGEIGLDYYWPEPDHETQKKWFLRQLDLAREIRKPVIIHSRDAAKDTVDLMTEARAEEIGGVIHCYSYTKETAKIFLDMGFYFGIGGVLTLKCKEAEGSGRVHSHGSHCIGDGLPVSGTGTEPRQTQQFPEYSLCDRCHGADQENHRGRSAQGGMGQFPEIVSHG